MNIFLNRNQLVKKPAAVHNTPSVTYPPKYSSKSSDYCVMNTACALLTYVVS